MKKMLIGVLFFLIILCMVACGHMDTPLESTPETNDSSENMMEEATEPNISSENTVGEPTEPENETENNMALSDMVVKITSQGNTATFQLYDTTAAAEFYEQLPLELELSNFSDAQWMFYPPEKLSVTENEAYHDGKKGELSYYEPWGDVVMFYGDFGSASGLYELGEAVSGSEFIEDMSGIIEITRLDS